MATNDASKDGRIVPMMLDSCTFDVRQDERLKDMEKRLQDKIKKKKKEWEKTVEKMKVEFLSLYPADHGLDKDSMPDNGLVLKRKGSVEVLDPEKLKTMILEYPDAGFMYKIRFDVSDYKEDSVQVTNDGRRVCVKAIKVEQNPDGTSIEQEYRRKIEPKHIDMKKMKSSLTTDGILIIEAPLLSSLSMLPKYAHSPSLLSSRGSSSHLSTRSRSPTESPESPPPPPKYGVAQFVGPDGEKVLSLMVDIGVAFKAKDIILQVCKDTVIQIKAKSSVKTPDFMSKHKYFREFELSEKIETLSLRGGLTESGVLMVAALAKGHPLFNHEDFSQAAKDGNINDIPCNILELANFPIIHQLLGSSKK